MIFIFIILFWTFFDYFFSWLINLNTFLTEKDLLRLMQGSKVCPGQGSNPEPPSSQPVTIETKHLYLNLFTTHTFYNMIEWYMCKTLQESKCRTLAAKPDGCASTLAARPDGCAWPGDLSQPWCSLWCGKLGFFISFAPPMTTLILSWPSLLRWGQPHLPFLSIMNRKFQ